MDRHTGLPDPGLPGGRRRQARRAVNTSLAWFTERSDVMTTALPLPYMSDVKSRDLSYCGLCRRGNTHRGLRIAQWAVSLLCRLILGEVNLRRRCAAVDRADEFS